MEMGIYAVQQQAQKTQARARAEFMEEGEKNTRYSVVKLEKARSNSKFMDRIKKDDGQVPTDKCRQSSVFLC